MNTHISTLNYHHFMPIMYKWSDEKQQPCSWSHARSSNYVLPIECSFHLEFSTLITSQPSVLQWPSKESICNLNKENYFSDNLNNWIFNRRSFLPFRGLGDSGNGLFIYGYFKFKTYSYQIYLLLSCQFKKLFLSAYYVAGTKMNQSPLHSKK